MKIALVIFFFILSIANSEASIKENIIKNLQELKTLSFNFEQNINGKIQNGNCIIEYPKKIYCRYNLRNKKILISNGKSLVIKTSTSYYLYPLKETPLNLILDKDYLLKKIYKFNEIIVENEIINFNFSENGNKIDFFFDKKTFDLIGWQTKDIYQNLSVTYISSLIKNEKIKKNLFKLPNRN